MRKITFLNPREFAFNQLKLVTLSRGATLAIPIAYDLHDIVISDYYSTEEISQIKNHTINNVHRKANFDECYYSITERCPLIFDKSIDWMQGPANPPYKGVVFIKPYKVEDLKVYLELLTQSSLDQNLNVFTIRKLQKILAKINRLEVNKHDNCTQSKINKKIIKIRLLLN